MSLTDKSQNRPLLAHSETADQRTFHHIAGKYENELRNLLASNITKSSLLSFRYFK
jgi:hypothetical protein